MNDEERLTEVKTVMEIGGDGYLTIYDLDHVSIRGASFRKETGILRDSYAILNKKGEYIGTYYADDRHLVLIIE